MWVASVADELGVVWGPVVGLPAAAAELSV